MRSPRPSTWDAARSENVSDADLIDELRRGDPDGSAFRVLFDRHWRFVRTAARRFGAGRDCDDVAQEAMLRVLEAIERGGGPTHTFRSYALTTARHVAINWSHRPYATALGSAVEVESAAPAPTGVRGFDDIVADRSLLAQAFGRVPERYQEVLWYTVVEGRTPADLAAHYGLAPNGVAVLAARARESLRRAWLTAHLAQPELAPQCQSALGVMVRRQRGDGLPASVSRRLERHLETCARCRQAALSVRVLGDRLPAAIGPLLAAAGVAIPAPIAAVASAWWSPAWWSPAWWSSAWGSSAWGSSAWSPHGWWHALGAQTKAVAGWAAVGVAGATVASGLWLNGRGDVPTPTPTPTLVASTAPTAPPLTAAPAAPVPPPVRVEPAASPEPAPPAVPVLETGDDQPWLLPILAGVGEPGARVVVLDRSGSAVGEARVAPSGSWRIDAWSLPTGRQVLRAVQEARGLRSQESAPVTVERDAPKIGPVESAPDGEFVVPITGEPGRWVSAALDATPAEAMPIPADGVLRAVWPGMGSGAHSFAVWYVEPQSGRTGATRTAAIEVP
ncbi:sigma-70 family RNA polymerase sigma factor [Xylanimonas ulmi]|uniref:RNA polymerase sigma factor (Sigma-70 family) n=1 Tax=Xylanimonas ulmi TaxID=228973 RepID=A0A4Q7M577_9MICO|nr:sigma-70 family RNA polymerase sigma factor [Xylanibacterium ulmi]RZS62571.1 RNA polymerase sigma factor (sigma-70 family) [Xylanibacterium ulmi]